MRRSVILLVLLFGALLGAMAAVPTLEQAPALRASNGPGQFNAQHAKARLAFIVGDQRPHAADTPADDQVRARLIATLRQMGLSPMVRDQFACNELYKNRGISCARVRNVIAVMGPPAGKALLINAHYDSVPVGPGASDDGIGVATMLGVADALRQQPLKRPVVLLFNEGEELGLIGARAFLSDPLSQHVDALVNLEARGVRGPVNMFETSRPNSAPIAIFARAVNRPTANSLSTDVYRLMPNYTDVNSLSERHWLTLNLAPIGNETRYHSPGDDIAALDPATLQHMGDQTLALAQALANGTPKQSGGDHIFMDLSGRTLISLPLIIGAILLTLLLIGFAAATVRRGGFAVGAAVVVPTMILSGLLAWIALALIGVFRHGMFWRAYPECTHLATYAGVLLIATLLLGTVARGMQVGQLRSSFWLLFAGVGALIGFLAPGGIVFFIFPPLVVLAGMFVARWWKPAEAVGAVLAILLLYFTWGAMLGLLQELLNGGPMWLFAPLASLLLLPALIEAKPLIGRASVRAVATLASVLVLAGWAVAAAVPAYSADRQQRFVIQHVSDLTNGKSWWSIVNDGAPLPPAFGSGWKWRKLSFGGAERWVTPAPPDATVRGATVQLLSQTRNGDQRTIALRLSSNGNDDIELVAPEDANIRAAGATGFVRPIDPRAKGKYYIGCSGRSCDGATFQLTAGMNPVRFLVISSRYALPSSTVRLVSARPKDARPQYTPDASISISRATL